MNDICSNPSLTVAHSSFDAGDSVREHNVRKSLHGEVKVWSQKEIDELNKTRGTTNAS